VPVAVQVPAELTTKLEPASEDGVARRANAKLEQVGGRRVSTNPGILRPPSVVITRSQPPA